MLDQRIDRTCLCPHDLAVCQRVFDQVCADESLDPLSLDAERLATMVVEIFLNDHTEERKLLDTVRTRRAVAPSQSFAASHPPENPAARRDEDPPRREGA